MQDLVSPVVEQGVKHKEQFLHNIGALNDHESRIGFLEYAIFKSEKAEDRFEQLFRKIAEMEQARAADVESLKAMWLMQKADLDDTVFNQEQKLKKVEQFEKVVA